MDQGSDVVFEDSFESVTLTDNFKDVVFTDSFESISFDIISKNTKGYTYTYPMQLI